MKPIAIAFSDIHLNIWKKFNGTGTRTAWLWKIMKNISDAAIKYNVPVLFPGDWAHNPKYLENGLLREMVFNYQECFEARGVQLMAISGNHDMSEKNSFEKRSPSYIDTFSQIFKTFTCLDFARSGVHPHGFRVFGIPYLNGNVGFNKQVKWAIENMKKGEFNILMIHTDLPGATDIHGREIGEDEGINTKLFRKFDLVLDGHIHKPQKTGVNTFILGSPYQQTRSEKGLELGYWKIYKEKIPKFVPLNGPKFIDIPEGEPIPDDGNFYTVIKKSKVKLEGTKNFHNSLDRSELGKNYLNHIKEQNKTKRKALLKTLNSVE